jgi:hypothetical protein
VKLRFSSEIFAEVLQNPRSETERGATVSGVREVNPDTTPV